MVRGSRPWGPENLGQPGLRGWAMMRVVALVVWLVGCSSNPINTCDDIDIDCCESDLDCVDVYGSLYPECVDPGPVSGTCSECDADNDCPVGSTCVIEEHFGSCVAGS